MVARIDPAALLSPRQKADIILSHAQSEMRESLWRAALSDASDDAENNSSSSIANLVKGEQSGDQFGLAALLSALGIGDDKSVAQAQGASAATCDTDRALGFIESASAKATEEAASISNAPLNTAGLSNLGANAAHKDALSAASQRTGIPPAALAAIVDAEAAKGKNGAWNAYSRNSRSSAAGLGQFLSGTWVGMAQQSGTWLNQYASQQGWLGSNGKVKGEARSTLLALRYDSKASIETIADYSRSNVDRLRAGGVAIGDDVRSLANAAYVGHHLGPGDALRFYRGTISQGRARELLNAQIGASSASTRIASTGDATTAHRNWLTSYISKSVRPERYTQNG
jgi:hypothetical protein